MLLGLDFDETFTLAPAFWRQFIASAFDAGHRVILCSARHETEENMMLIEGMVADSRVPIVLCDHLFKDEVARARGYKVDVWIDDSPEMIRPRYSQEAL